MSTEERRDLGAVVQTITLTVRATRRQVAPMMRYPGGEWESDGTKGTYQIPLSGGIVIKIAGQDGEWWVSGKDILESLLSGAAEQSGAASGSVPTEGGPYGA